MKLLRLYIDSYSKHPKEIWSLAILSLINRMGAMVLPFLSLYFTTELNFTLEQTGYLISALGVGMFCGSYLGGKLSEIIGSRIVMILSLISAGIMLITLQFFTDFYTLMVLMFLTSLLGDAYRPAMMVSAQNFVPKEQMGRTMSLIRLMINIGMAIGPALGGYLATYAGYKWLFWVDGLTCVVAAIFLLIVSANWKSDAVKKKVEEVLDQEDLPKIPVLKNRRYLLFLLATFLMGFAFIQWFHTVPYFLKTEWGFGEYPYGQMLAFSCGIIVLIEMPLIHHIEKVKWIKPALYIGLLCIGVSYLMFFLPAYLWMGFLIIAVWTIGETLHLPLNSSEAINLSPENQKGAYMAYFWMTWSLTGIISPLVGFNFVDRFGFTPFWWILFGACIVSLFLFHRLLRSPYSP